MVFSDPVEHLEPIEQGPSRVVRVHVPGNVDHEVDQGAVEIDIRFKEYRPAAGPHSAAQRGEQRFVVEHVVQDRKARHEVDALLAQAVQLAIPHRVGHFCLLAYVLPLQPRAASCQHLRRDIGDDRLPRRRIGKKTEREQPGARAKLQEGIDGLRQRVAQKAAALPVHLHARIAPDAVHLVVV